jgi:probable phosphoglycerate mutase
MCGRWKVKHPDMIPLAARARELVGQFDDVTFEWIPRLRNKRADKLANEAMDARDEAVERVDPAEFEGAKADTAPPESVVTAPIPEPDDAAATNSTDKESATPTPGWTGAIGRPTRLLLLRHGQTALSVERRYSGRGNPPLTELGRDQAQRAARWVAAKGGITAVVCSPLGRARETAEAAAHALGLEVEIHEGLIETDFGEWEGLTFAEASARDPEVHGRWLGDVSVPPPGGESFDQVRARIEAVRDDLVARYPAANVLVVTHVTPIKTLLQMALGVGPSLLYRLHLDLASLSIAEFYPDGGASVRLANGTGHLDG